MSYDIVVAGVGGQGVVYLCNLIAEAAMIENKEFRVFVDKGHAKREGSVVGHIRIGDSFSPTISTGEAQMIIGLEPLETLRNIHFADKDTQVIYEDKKIIPPLCATGDNEYPDDYGVRIKKVSKNVKVTNFSKDSGKNLNVMMFKEMTKIKESPLSEASVKETLSKKDKGWLSQQALTIRREV